MSANPPRVPRESIRDSTAERRAAVTGGDHEQEWAAAATASLPRVWRRVAAALVLATGLVRTAPPVHAESAYRLLAAGDLAALTNRFEPGDVVLLPNATWTDTKLIFRGKGTPEKPITLRPGEPGRFTLAGQSSLTIDGEWLVVEGIQIKDAGVADSEGIVIKGRHNRLTASVVDGSTHKYAVRLLGARHRVDHCYFAGKTSEGPTLQVEVDAREPNRHRIDFNHFGPRPPLGRNGGETIRVGYSFQSMYESGTVVERNLFERCDGEIEIISSKSGGNVYRGNTFRECAGMLTLRHGDRNVVDGNYFFGGGKKGSGGIRIIGEDHVVTNNYIEGVDRGAFWITAGVPNSEPHQYVTAKRALIAFNTVVDSAGPYLDLAAGLGSAGRTLKPAGIVVAKNLFRLGDRGALVAGEEGDGWVWQGNAVHEASGSHAGIRQRQLTFNRDASGMLRLTSVVPPERVSLGSFPRVEFDIDGDPRGSSPASGCDEPSTSHPILHPLMSEHVGPPWRIRPRGGNTL